MNCANHSDREKVAFCQNCGKPLCQECTRVIGQAVYCEPCLAAKLAAAPPVPPAGAYVYNDPASGINASGTSVGGTSVGGTYGYAEPASGVYAPGVVPPHPAHGAPNPVLAGLLGFIPGVGAMYNEQYVKGGVHLIVFVVLVSLANSNGIFGIFVAGWEFYMAFEAYQTARARRDGLPLPNPFGLNDLGHKLGLDKTWNMGNNYTGAPPTTPPDPYAAPYNAPPAGAAYTPPYAPPYSAGAVPPSWAAPPAWEPYTPPVPPQMPPQVPLDAQVPYPGNRFPAGAIWLIGLGALFLLTNGGVLHGVSARLFLPILFIGLAVFIFVRKMTSYGYGLSDDGTVDYRLRIFRALRSSVWLALVGLLFFLNEFDILTWDHSWPLFIILAGIMTFLKFAVYGSAPPVPPYMPPYGYPPQPAPPAAPAPATSTSTQIVPTTAHDQEGS